MTNDDYKQKYEKYKYKYLNLRNEIIKDKYDTYIDNKYSKLFYDLLEASQGIIKLTSNTDFIILVGDTPSYLKPFLEDPSLSDRRTTFNLPFSNKPSKRSTCRALASNDPTVLIWLSISSRVFE